MAPIPDFDHNLVLPPHLGDPCDRSQISPYPCSTVDLCERFNTSSERRTILGNFLNFRARIIKEGIRTGFQWLDGSFLENIEKQENRAPRDLDVLTVFWGYKERFLTSVFRKFPEFASRNLSKTNYSLDHFPIDAGYHPEVTLESTRYWISLFSHNRLGVWKGMLKIDLNTPDEDIEARRLLGE